MTQQTDRLDAALSGHYRIERELGAGGMATVYLAHDERHHRSVALKVLKPELAAVIGADRFLNEIKTTASLQHPNILPLHDSGEVNGTVWYVMPLVEGEALRDRLARETQLPVDDAITIAREVASALDYAHRHGVIHRDIKPENILLHDGRAVVADFGIALAVSRTDGGTRLTETGMSLGTPFYMSPEQALGEKTVDARTDVYALGAVLYEMLVGEPPFTGPSAQAIIAKVMNAPPAPIAAIRPTVPIAIEAAVMRALAKLPADRFKSAAEFASALRAGAGGAVATGAIASTGARVVAAPARNRALRALPWLLAGIAVVIAATSARRGASNDARVTATVIPLEVRTPNDLPRNEVGVPIDIANDGSFIVYVGSDPDVRGATALWKRPLDRLEATPITGTRGAQSPRISADGKRIFFLVRGPRRSGNVNKVVSTEGGIAQDPEFSGEAAYNFDDGRGLVLTRQGPRIYRNRAERSADSGIAVARERATVDLSPDGKLVAAAPRLGDSIGIGAVGRPLEFLTLGGAPRFLDDHTLAFRSTDGALMVGRLDATRRKFVGRPIAVLPAVAGSGTGSAIYSISRDGTLIYVPGGAAAEARLTWVTADGTASPVPGSQLRVYGGVVLAPDGRRAVTTVGALVGGGDLWLEDLVAGTRNPLTSDGVSTRASWSPDGKRVEFTRSVPGTSVQPVVGGRVYEVEIGTGAPADTIPGPWPNGGIAEFRWAPDMRSSAVRVTTPRHSRDVFVRLAGAKEPVGFAADSLAQERGPQFSPDGKWLLFASDKSGRDEVYVDAFPGGGHRTQISIEGGQGAIWSRDGSKIFFRSLDGWLTAATVARSTAVTVTKHERLFDANAYLTNQFLTMYDVAPDGRFLMLRLDAEAPRTDVVIIRNWVQQALARLKAGAQ